MLGMSMDYIRNRQEMIVVFQKIMHIAVRYNSGHSFESHIRILAGPFVKNWTLLVSWEA